MFLLVKSSTVSRHAERKTSVQGSEKHVCVLNPQADLMPPKA
jgi:hypothetical protein